MLLNGELSVAAHVRYLLVVNKHVLVNRCLPFGGFVDSFEIKVRILENSFIFIILIVLFLIILE